MQKKSKKGKKAARTLRIILTSLGLLCVIAVALVCAYRIWVRPPQIGNNTPTETPDPVAPKLAEEVQAERPKVTDPATGEQTQEDPFLEEQTQSQVVNSTRKEGVYTILLVGNDDGQGNTDTILVGKIDTVNHKMDFITIPRDTLINVPWELRKINCVYWGSRYSGGDGISALKTQVSRLLGFEPDCYVVVDLNVFMDAVDLIGGIYFDVPMDMNYEDPSQNLSIHLKKGYQLLNGNQAMGCVRFRKGYANGDLGRIETQHKFLHACADQFLTAGNIPHLPELLRLLADNLDTDLSAANLAFFAEEFLKCKSEDINFYTPNLGGGLIHGYSYVTLAVDNWLEMVNELINPYNTDVTWGDVDIVFYTAWGVDGTQGVRDPDYYVKGTKQDDEEEGDDAQPADGEPAAPDESGEGSEGTPEEPAGTGGEESPAVPGDEAPAPEPEP